MDLLLVEAIIDIALSTDSFIKQGDLFSLLAIITAGVGLIGNLYVMWSSVNPLHRFASQRGLWLLFLVLLTDVSDSLYLSGNDDEEAVGPLIAALLPLLAPLFDIFVIRLCRKADAEVSNLVLLQCAGSAVLVLFHALSAEFRSLVESLDNELGSNFNNDKNLGGNETSNTDITDTAISLTITLVATAVWPRLFYFW